MSNVQAKVEPASMDAIIGENVHRMMWRRRQTQTTLAPHLGMSQGALSRKMRGDRPWSAVEVKAAADYFGVSIESLFDAGYTPRDLNPEPTVSGSGAVVTTLVPRSVPRSMRDAS